ncbi:MAG: HD domain-containing protein [Bacteroidales bacterium]|nr:HD domain-containing protein [Bacteroidales bacterium]MCM1415974.1 HD domain-containing protein [bacterium]MCM1422757.1 HD domain-containing protein [bacterium]
MRLCKVDNLTGTEVLAKDAMTTEYTILLSAGTQLKPEYIEKLKELHIRDVYVKEEMPDTKQVAILKEDVEAGFKSKVKNILEKHTYSHNERLMELAQTADTIITNILEEEEVVEKIYDIKERSSDLYEHSISLCSLATLVALRMGLSQETVHDIGVSSLLHDLGLRYLDIPYENRNPDQLSEMEYAEYKKHPIYGYTTLRDENWISETVKNMILYHHERLDGSGYPLKTTDIPIECRIIQICEAFDEMICGIGCERSKVFEAVRYLRENRDIKFDGRIVDILLEFTAVYPAGTVVRTNEGETGIVLYQNRQVPDRPVIRITRDRNGTAVDMIKDMTEYSDLYIEGVEE